VHPSAAQRRAPDRCSAPRNYIRGDSFPTFTARQTTGSPRPTSFPTGPAPSHPSGRHP
jgi:hypothetical protein